MKRRPDNAVAPGVLGAMLLGAPMLHIVLGGAFGPMHAVLGSTGLALLVLATLGKEA